MPLSQLLKNLHKRRKAMADLDEVFRELFGDVQGDPGRGLRLGSAQRKELEGKFRAAIEALRTT